MKKKVRQSVNVSEFEEEYEFDDSIWNEDDEEINALKKILSNLPLSDKRLFILYMEVGSLRTVAKQLGVGLTTTMKEIKAIKNKIIEEYNKTYKK